MDAEHGREVDGFSEADGTATLLDRPYGRLNPAPAEFAHAVGNLLLRQAGRSAEAGDREADGDVSADASRIFHTSTLLGSGIALDSVRQSVML